MAAVVATASARMVVTAGLAANDPAVTVYVVWGVGAADPQPIGTFDIDAAAAGPAMRSLGPPDGGDSSIGYAISREPGRSAPAAPTTVVASGQVPG